MCKISGNRITPFMIPYYVVKLSYLCICLSYTMSQLSTRRLTLKLYFIYTVALLFMMMLTNGWISILVNDAKTERVEEHLKFQSSSLNRTREFILQVSSTRISVKIKRRDQGSLNVTNDTFLKHGKDADFIYTVFYTNVNEIEAQFKTTKQSKTSTSEKLMRRENAILESPAFEKIEHNLISGQTTNRVLNISKQNNTGFGHLIDHCENLVDIPAVNLTNSKFASEFDIDISDLDDHIYLVENQDFKRLLENGVELGFMQERMWKERHILNSTYADRKRVFNLYYKNIENQGHVDCNGILEKDDGAIKYAKEFISVNYREGIRTENYIKMKDCENFKRNRGYIEHPLSDSERAFPLAFGIIMYRDVEQTERLLRAIYRPHNLYCIHVDRKSDRAIRLAVENIARCFRNVFLATKLENVTWGEFTVLQADLNCMDELLKYKSWKYYINLTGQEFPLKTNREIVEVLKAMDGANIVDGTWVRANEKHFYRWTSAGNRPPHGIRPIKGSVHVLVNRHFVEFCLHDARALDFLAWLQKTQIPDETYFASLNHNPHLGIKGSFLGEPEAYPLKPAFMRYKNWGFGHSSSSRPCTGKYVRHICILGVGDLHSAFNDIALFVNKFHLDYEYLALDCLEEVLHEKTWQQYLEDTPVNVSYYKNLDYVKYKFT